MRKTTIFIVSIISVFLFVFTMASCREDECLHQWDEGVVETNPTKPVEAVLVGWGGILWNRFYITEEEKVYTFTTNSKNGDLTGNFEWQFGSSNNQKYTDVTIEINDILISYKNSEYDGD